MKNFTKLTLILSMLFGILGGVNSVKARTNIDMSTATASANATWDLETNTFAWTAENAYIVIPGLSGDLTGCYLDFTIGAACRIDIVDKEDNVKNGDWNGYGRFGSAGSKTQDLGFMVSGSSCDITKVKEVRICSQSASGSLTVTSVSYYYPVVPQFNADGVATINLKSLVASGGLSFDPSTGVVTCNGNTGTLSLEFLNGVNLTNLKRYDVSISGTDNIMWRSIVKSQGTDILAYYGSRWGGNLTDDQRAKALSVNEFFWESKSKEQIEEVEEANRTFTITSITLTAEKMSVADSHDVPIATLPHYNVAADGTVSLGSVISTGYGSDVDSPLGDGADDNDEYIDISDYDELRIYTSEFATNHPRVFFFNADPIVEGTKSTKGTTLYLNDAIFSYNSTENYYYATITAIKGKCNGLAKVIGVKKNSYSAPAITVSKIQVYKANPTYDYILSGQYSSAIDISTVTSDVSATAIDCTGLSGNNVSITSVNKNCMFKANAGVLSNSMNVIVGSTCANLVLTDGYPFKAPANFTATSASYDRSIAAGTTTTVCLPFDLTQDECEAIGTFYELKGLNGDGSKLQFEEVSKTEAGKPYLVVNTSGAPKTFTSLSGDKNVVAGDAITVDGTNSDGTQFIGTLASTLVKSVAEGDTYYGLNNGTFVKAGTSGGFTLPAFRGYVKVSGGGAARLGISFINDEVTGIKSVVNSQEQKAGSQYFDLQGRRVSKPVKGLYVVNGKKMVIK